MLCFPQAAKKSTSPLKYHSFDNSLTWALSPWQSVHPMHSVTVEFSVGKGTKPKAQVSMAL